ncbi:type I-C CRISPR-associated protein Cas8c/Csd1 [Cypionkella sp. TWP1-2-1b2]|uniref:type I-C CRISPR-associated protein Cas8c/Csd1 n=1 Tax=Cypionkella sp. TWP1-2-1b2 TaxID=2804675 RepID=UPI003CEEC507
MLCKHENVPPNLAGDWMRAILAGQPYPLTLLFTTLMGLHGDGDVNAWLAGILKSVLGSVEIHRELMSAAPA